MTIQEKIEITFKALVRQEGYGSIAKEHRISQSRVSQLVCKAKRNKNFYSEILAGKVKVEEKFAHIKDAINTMIEKHTFLDSVASIHQAISNESNLAVKEKDVKHVLKHELQMSYKKVLPVSIHANSTKNLVLRQQFALRLLELLQSKKVVLNIDETWLGMCDFRRRKWQPKGSTNSVPQLPL